MEGFKKTIPASELSPGMLRTVMVEGEQVLLANSGGKFYGMGAICNHAHWDLSEGSIEGKTVVCAGHGSRWDLETGEAEFHTPLEPEPLYEVAEEGGFLWVRRKRL